MTSQHTTPNNYRYLVLLGCLLLLPLAFRADTTDPVLGIRNLGLGSLALLALLLCWKERASLWSALPRQWAVVWGTFVAINLIGIPFAHNAWEALYDAARLFTFTSLLYFLVQSFRMDPNLFRFAHRCLVLLSIALGIIGSLQLMGMARLIPGGPGVPYATMWGTNFLGSAMLFLFPLNLGAIANEKGLWKAGGMLGALLSTTMIWAAKASGPILGLAAVLLLAAYFTGSLLIDHAYRDRKRPAIFQPKARKIALVGASLLGAVLAFLIYRPDNLLSTSSTVNVNSQSEVERLLLWQESLEIFAESPVIGVGAGNWKFHILEKGVSSQYQGFATRYYVRAHNDFVQAFAERGLLGGLAFLLFVVGTLVAGVIRFDKEKQRSVRIQVAMASCGLLAWAVVANFSFPAERPFHFTMLIVLVAMIACRYPAQPPAKTISTLFLGGLSFLILLGIVPLFLTMQTDVDSKLILDSKHRQNWPEVIQLAESADGWPTVYDRHSFTPYAWYVGNAYLNLQKFSEAMPYLQRAADLHPWHPQVLSNYGAALAATGQLDTAVVVLENLLISFPDFDEVRQNLTEIYVATGQKSPALRTIGYWEKNRKPNLFSVYCESVRERLGEGLTVPDEEMPP